MIHLEALDGSNNGGQDGAKEHRGGSSKGGVTLFAQSSAVSEVNGVGTDGGVIRGHKDIRSDIPGTIIKVDERGRITTSLAIDHSVSGGVNLVIISSFGDKRGILTGTGGGSIPQTTSLVSGKMELNTILGRKGVGDIEH